MEPLIIDASSSTPEVLMQAENNICRISGNCYPESPELFFQPVLEWLQEYLLSCKNINEIPLHFEFNYYNTSTSKVIAKLFRMIQDSPNSNKVNIFWHYDETDKDMLKAGQRFSSLYELKFHLKPVV